LLFVAAAQINGVGAFVLQRGSQLLCYLLQFCDGGLFIRH
jgi:hypothetical protein